MPRLLARPAVLLLLVLLVLATATGIAARPARAEDDADARRERYAALEQEVYRAFAERRYADAEAKCREQVALEPIEEGAHYNLACALARQGKAEAALASLAKAVDLGYGDADHLAEDEDLASLRETKGWAGLVAAARAEQTRAEAKLYVAPTDVKGVKTLEGHPEGGLRWRLRISPEATAKAPHRLVLWLHPSGGSMNAKVEPLATDLAPKGWALAAPTQKRWEGWSDAEGKRLLEKTLPDLAKVEGLDAKRPVLLGFSAGGQMALRLWAQDPARWGGLVLDAAYPIDAAAYAEGRVEPLGLPEGDAVRGTPLFVVVGDADGGHRLWKQVEEPWRAAGVPLRVTYVPGGQHQWLIGKDEGAALLAWLQEIRAGRVPAPSPPAPAPTPTPAPTK